MTRGGVLLVIAGFLVAGPGIARILIGVRSYLSNGRAGQQAEDGRELLALAIVGGLGRIGMGAWLSHS